MKENKTTKKEDAPGSQLIPLADYCAPDMPADGALRALWRRLKKRLLGGRAGSGLPPKNRLRAIDAELLDEVAAGPAYGPLLDGFDASVQDWFREGDSRFHRVLVLPPCDSDDVLYCWAQERGHRVLQHPERGRRTVLHASGAASDQKQTAAKMATMLDDDSSLLVIPQLETWFLRQRNGLHDVRDLLARLQHCRARCLIGCNSWAWAFLQRAVGAGVVLPEPVAFPAFDAQCLHGWLGGLAQQGAGEKTPIFRLLSNGKDVFAVTDDGCLQSSYLEELAARSNGIPWAAWSLWREALRTGKRTHDEQAQGQGDVSRDTDHDSHSEREFWIADISDPQLPAHREQDALLVLHALLIHGPLDHDALHRVLPDGTPSATLPALLRSCYLEQNDKRLRVLPAAYPALRQQLQAADFPMGVI